jgi:pimeloyl-ACP methyl ester carboxylesterase
MWRPLIPRLASTHTVIAPDLPGIGGSAIPSDGLDMAHAAARMHALVKSLGVNKAAVVGHDIGLMVAYAYAAQFPDEVDRLVLMDAFLPGVEGWETIYNNPAIWHFRFNGLRRLGVLRVVSAGSQGLRTSLTNETHDAGTVHRWRESKRCGSWPTGSARGHECSIGDAAEHRALGDGGEPEGDDGRARRVSRSIGGDSDGFVSERAADVAGIEVDAPADAIDAR